MKLSNYQKITLLLSYALLLVFAGCAGTKQPGKGFDENTPDEIQRMIQREYSQAIYAVGTATGPEEGIAQNKAVMQARAEIARQFKSQIDALQRSYEEAINIHPVEDYSQVMEVFATIELSGSRIAKSMSRLNRNGTYSAKVLVVVSAEQVKAIIDEKMQAYTSFKASEAYKELEERVAKERERRLKGEG